MEFINPEGLRQDGRRPGELRHQEAELDCLSHANGSARLNMGNTQVIAAVFGPHETTNRGDMQYDRAIVNCEVATAGFASGRRMGKTDRRSADIARAVKGSLEQTILLELMPRSQIDVSIQVLVAEGGVLSACINAAVLALAQAGVPLRDLMAACTVGYLESTPLMDLNFLEEAGDGPTVTVAVHQRSDTIPLMQLDQKMPMDTLDEVMELAVQAAKATGTFLKQALLQHVQQMAVARGIQQ